MSTTFDGTIYLKRNRVNGKGYVGQTTIGMNKRDDGHRSAAVYGNSDALYHRAIRKHGWEAFDTETLATGIANQADLDAVEILFIDLYGTRVPNGYNISEGGKGGDGRAGATKRVENREWFVSCAPEFAEYQKRRDAARHRKHSETLRAKTPAERSASKRKSDETLGAEGRSAAARKALATLGPNGRRARAQKAMETLAVAGLSARSRKLHDGMTATARSERTRKGHETRRRNKLADLSARLKAAGGSIADQIMEIAA